MRLSKSPVGSGAAKCEVGDVGVCLPLPAEGRHLAVAGHEADVVAQRPEPLRNGSDELGVVAAGKIRAPDRACEEHVAHQRQLCAGMKEHHVAWGMAGTVAD